MKTLHVRVQGRRPTLTYSVLFRGCGCWTLRRPGCQSEAFGGIAIFALDDSAVSIESTGVLDFVLEDRAVLEIRDDGRIEDLEASGGSTVLMTGGAAGVRDGTTKFGLLGRARAEVSGGRLARVQVGEESTLILDGTVQVSAWLHRTEASIILEGAGLLDMRGGTLATGIDVKSMDAMARISWGEFDFIDAFSGLVEILGTDLSVDGMPVGSGDILAIQGQLTGTLASGEELDIAIFRGEAGLGVIRLNIVPEPSTSLLLALGLIALGRHGQYGRRGQSTERPR